VKRPTRTPRRTAAKPDATAATEPPPAREWLAVAMLTALGLALRFVGSGRLGLTHFDEGIYALAGLWSQSRAGLSGIDPSVISYAPPAFPILVGLSYTVLGIDDLSAIFVSQSAGVLTIPVVAWLGRRTFGPGAGAAAAAFAATSGPQVAFSRMALTDSTFLLAWLVALGLGMRFLERPGFSRAIGFGLAVGLAQNSKYNGWLAGCIVAAAWVPSLIRRSNGEGPDWRRAASFGLLAAGIAALVYLPWFLFVESHGGYSRLLAHHRSYLGGMSQWYPHWRAQLAQAIALSGSLVDGLNWGMAAWALAWLACAFALRGRTDAPLPRWLGGPFLAGLSSGMIVLGASANTPYWISLAMTPWLIVARRASPRVVGVSWLAMALLTPFYHPYARLWLPLHANGWLIMAGVTARLCRSSVGRVDVAPTVEPSFRWIGPALLLSIMVSLAIDRGGRPRARPLTGLLGPADDVRLACAEILGAIPKWKSPVVRRIRAFARPPLVFYLGLGSDVPIDREPGPEFLDRPPSKGDAAVLDTAALPSSVDARRFEFGWVPLANSLVQPTRPPPPTLLDIEPEAAYGGPSRAYFIKLLVPRAANPGPSRSTDATASPGDRR
jgi:dolichyl-phosphate-mannose-protein mannosyltransferase